MESIIVCVPSFWFQHLLPNSRKPFSLKREIKKKTSILVSSLSNFVYKLILNSPGPTGFNWLIGHSWFDANCSIKQTVKLIWIEKLECQEGYWGIQSLMRKHGRHEWRNSTQSVGNALENRASAGGQIDFMITLTWMGIPIC